MTNLNVRAGIIYLLVYNQYTYCHILEIVYWSGLSDKIKTLIDINNILNFQDKDINYVAPVDFTIESCFRKNTELAQKYLAGVSINLIAYYYYEYSFIDRIINPAKLWRKNTIGHKNENNTLNILNYVYGYDIVRVQRKSIVLDNLGIIISGTPDGIIKSSPGNIFNGYLVEIKYGRCISADQVQKNIVQIAAYSKIFGMPVLLISYYHGKYWIKRYSLEKLAKVWDNLCPRLKDTMDIIRSKILIDSPAEVGEYLAFTSEK